MNLHCLIAIKSIECAEIHKMKVSIKTQCVTFVNTVLFIWKSGYNILKIMYKIISQRTNYKNRKFSYFKPHREWS